LRYKDTKHRVLKNWYNFTWENIENVENIENIDKDSTDSAVDYAFFEDPKWIGEESLYKKRV